MIIRNFKQPSGHVTNLGFQIECGKQATKADELTDHHAEFEDLLVGELGSHSVKKSIIHTMVIGGQSFGVFQR